MVDSSTKPQTKKRTRCVTTLHQFTSGRPTGYRFPLEFDHVTKQPFGQFATKFKSYVAMLARNKASILAETWKNVDEEVKNLIWSDILQTFDIPNDEKLKNYWISYAGERWTQFKSTLTRDYVFGSGDKQGNTTPCQKYPCISTEIWELFVKSRMEEKFQSKRQRAKEVQSQNNFYHTTSRGGYPMIKDNWKKNYVEARREESGDPDLVIEAPSPPRHELFKLAHQRKTGSFTTDKSASVASKIDELVDQATQGTFVPQGRQDILAVAIGKPDHFGRVRAAGRGVGLSIYFGHASRTSFSTSNSKKFETMKQELREELREELRGELREELKKYKDLKQDLREEFGDPLNDHISLKNTIGSKASCSPSHVEEPLKNDWLRELYIASYDMTGHIKFDLDHEPQEHFYIGSEEIVDMIKGRDLELSHLGIWCTYLHRECIKREISHVYGFLDPYKVCGSNKAETIQSYIQKKLIDQNKTCFLAPYLIGKHWQLFVICPTANTVVWMCSLHNPPPKELFVLINNAMNVYYRMKGLRTPKPQWVTPKVAKQNDAYSCGYYVMINMMTIVSATITNNWKKVFNSTDPFTSEELKDIRQVWAEFFLRLYAEERKPVGKEERRNQL